MHQLKITGSAELPEALELDHTYLLGLEADCQSISKHSNNNGTAEYVYKLKLLKASIEKDSGQRIQTKDTRKQSQKLRQAIEFTRLEHGREETEEEYYEKCMIAVRHNLQVILEKECLLKQN